MTVDTALRLARYFGTSAQMWVNLQAKYELAAAEDSSAGRSNERFYLGPPPSGTLQ